MHALSIFGVKVWALTIEKKIRRETLQDLARQCEWKFATKFLAIANAMTWCTQIPPSIFKAIFSLKGYFYVLRLFLKVLEKYP